MNALRFRILGAFEAWSGDDRVQVGGKQSVRVLTVLLAEAGRVVPVTNLVHATWGEAAPSTSAHQVRKIAADLRRRIPGGQGLITTDGPGYRIDTTGVDLDLTRFHTHLSTGKALAESDPARAVVELSSALALWSPILAGDGGEVVDALSELVHARYVAAAELAVDLRLGLEPPAAVIPDLVQLVQREPLVEGLRAQLIRALYLAGRQGEALSQYDVVRHLLADELGVDPGAALREVHAAVLANDTRALHGDTAEVRGRRTDDMVGREAPTALVLGHAAAVPTPHAAPTTLPRRPSNVVGRREETAQVLSGLAESDDTRGTVVLLHGLGGVGKSTLGLSLAHELADRFPDGQLFVEVSDPSQGTTRALDSTLEQLFLAVGLSPAEIPPTLSARVDRWRMLTSRRSMLLLLDGATRAGDVLPLLLAGPRSLTIVTAHTRLSELDDCLMIRVDPLSEDDGIELLRRTVGEERVDGQLEAARELVRRCEGIPLVMRLVAIQLQRSVDVSIPAFIARLEDEDGTLESLSSRGRSLAASIRMSVSSLPPGCYEALTAIAGMPWAPVAVPRAAAAAWVGRPMSALAPQLDELEESHLVESRDGTRIVMHDLLRRFCVRDRPMSADEERAARGRLARYLLRGCEDAAAILAPGRRSVCDLPDTGGVEAPRLSTPAQARRWFSQHDRLLSAALSTLDAPDEAPYVVHIVRGFAVYLLETGLTGTGQEAGELAVVAARQLEDPALERLSLGNLAVFQWRGGHARQADATLRAALGIAEEMGDSTGRAAILARLGAIRIDAGELASGCAALDGALEGLGTGQVRERASALGSLASAHLRLGHPEEAERCAREALPLDGSAMNRGLCHLLLASAHEVRDEFDEACAELEQALAAYELLPGTDRLGLTQAHLAWALVRCGDTAGARVQYQSAELAQGAMSVQGQALLEILLAAADAAEGRTGRARERHERALAHAMDRGQAYEAAVALDGLAQDALTLGELATSMELSARAEAEFARIGASPRWFRQET